MYLPKTLFDFGTDKSGAWLEFWARRSDTEGRGGISKTLFLSRMEGFEFNKQRCDRMWNNGRLSPRFRYDPKTATIYWISRHKQSKRFVQLTEEDLGKIKKIGDFTAIASAIIATNVIAKAKDCIARGRTLRTIGRTTDTVYKSTVSARIARAVKKGWVKVKAKYINEFGINWRIRNDYESPVSNGKDKFSPSFNCPINTGSLSFILPSLEPSTIIKNRISPGYNHPAGYNVMMDRHSRDLFVSSY